MKVGILAYTNGLKFQNFAQKMLFLYFRLRWRFKKNVSVNLISSIKFAKKRKAKIFGIVGRKKSFLKKNGDCVITVPEINKKNITPYSEAYQAVIWHSIVSHPELKFNKTKW